MNRRIAILIAPLWMLLSCSVALASTPTGQGGKIATSLSFVGHDQLTQALVVSLEKSLVATGKYEFVSEGEQQIRLEIPGNLYWQDVRGRTNFHYVIVMVGARSKYLGTVTGSCWLDQMDSCVKLIIEDIAKSGALAGLKGDESR